MLNPNSKIVQGLSEKVVKQHASGFDMDFASFAVCPQSMSLGLQNYRNAPIKLADEFTIDRLKPNPSVVAFSVNRSISKLNSDNIGEFRSWFCHKMISTA